MINEINALSSLQLSLTNASLQLKEGDKISFSVIKLLTNGMYLINLKVRPLLLFFKILPNSGNLMQRWSRQNHLLSLKLLEMALSSWTQVN